jgi:hypothetical protein
VLDLWSIFVEPLMTVTNDFFFTILVFVLTAVAYINADGKVGPALGVWIFSFLTFTFAGVREPVNGMYFGFFVVGAAGVITNLIIQRKG